VQVRKLESTDAFLVVDLPSAPAGVGIVRLAPKVLVDGAGMLARSVTYAFAAFGVQATGVSAGINAKPDGRDDAVAAFCDEMAPLAAEAGLRLTPSTGVTAEDLAPLGEAAVTLDADLGARGAVAAAGAFGGGTAGVAGPAAGEWADRLAEAWPATGGTWAGAGDLGADVDVLFVAGKAGVVDDEAARTVAAKHLVALTPVPVTAKAYAVLNRASVTFVPDTLSCAAPLLALVDPDGGDPVERVAALAAEVAAEGTEPWRAIVDRAERFLATWQDELPFGRPLA
jgi:hypothetical protein